MTVAVVKLGVGNTASVMFALERLGARAILTDEAAAIAEAERVILPGVGAAGYAMQRIAEMALTPVLKGFARPILGICLGQQLLLEESEEGDVETLALLKGKVTRLEASRAFPSPHVGWSRLRLRVENAILDGVRDDDYAYFVHSYVCPVSDATLATADHGGAFAAIVGEANRYGCQFHPERSGAVGARILANFLALPC